MASARGPLLAMLLSLAPAVLAQTVFAPVAVDKPALLVASVQEREQETRQTVVLAMPGPQGGHFGVILNRPTRRSMQSLFPDDKGMAVIRDPAYYGGGPLNRAIVAIAKTGADGSPGPGSVEILPGAYFVFRATTIDRVISERPNDARYYAGYMTWKDDDLGREIERGKWLTIEVDAEYLFRRDTDGLWEELVYMARGPEHPDAGLVAIRLSEKLYARGRYAEVEVVARHELAMREKRLGPDHFRLAGLLNMLGAATLSQRRFAEAEQYFKRALAILEKSPETTPGQLETILSNIVDLYERQERGADAAPFIVRLRALEARKNGAK